MRHHTHLLCLTASALILAACSNEDGDTTANASRASSKQADAAATADDTATKAASADILALGAAAWKKGNCTLCHGSDGSGNRFGPDLTNDQWSHTDGSVTSIRAILATGIPKEKFADTSYAMSMPSATLLIPDAADLDALATYVRNLSDAASGSE